MRTDLEWSQVKSYRAIFWGYAVVGIIKLLLALALSTAVEAEKKVQTIQDPETAPLLGDGAEDEEPKKSQNWFMSRIPDIGIESRVIVFNLCILFALDAFASGLAPL